MFSCLNLHQKNLNLSRNAYCATGLLCVGLILAFSACVLNENDYKSVVSITNPATFTSHSGETGITDVSADFDIEVEYLTDFPEEINLNVLFYSQAPYSDWGMPYQEACEEASLLLAYYYATNQHDVTREAFQQDLLNIIDFENGYFGDYKHTTIAQTAEIATIYLNFTNYEIINDPTVDQLKAFLAAGDVIVTPFAGRYLGNPYFTGEGPIYHNLVIRGYDETYFITNDVGTRHGENFIYEYDVLLNALHDWHDSAAYEDEGILRGAKTVLIIKPISL